VCNKTTRHKVEENEQPKLPYSHLFVKNENGKTAEIIHGMSWVSEIMHLQKLSFPSRN
jgi:hypothetical protein